MGLLDDAEGEDVPGAQDRRVKADHQPIIRSYRGLPDCVSSRFERSMAAADDNVIDLRADIKREHPAGSIRT